MEQLIQEISEKAFSDSKQIMIPRVNCLDSVDRTTLFLCSLSEKLTGSKEARWACYKTSAAFGKIYAGSCP